MLYNLGLRYEALDNWLIGCDTNDVGCNLVKLYNVQNTELGQTFTFLLKKNLETVGLHTTFLIKSSTKTNLMCNEYMQFIF